MGNKKLEIFGLTKRYTLVYFWLDKGMQFIIIGDNNYFSFYNEEPIRGGEPCQKVMWTK